MKPAKRKSLIVQAPHRSSGKASSAKACVSKLTRKKLELADTKHREKITVLTVKKPTACEKIISELKKRIDCADWIIALKSLITFHHLMSEGSDSFSECLTKFSSVLQLDTFHDSSSLTAQQQSAFVRVYAKCLHDKLGVYKTLHVYLDRQSNYFDNLPCREVYLKLPLLITQLDSCLQCGHRLQEVVNNPISSHAYKLCLYDIEKLYNVLGAAILRIQDEFFHMPLSEAVEAVEAYKSYLLRSTRAHKVFEEAHTIFGNIPTLQHVNTRSLSEMQTYANFLKESQTNMKKSTSLPESDSRKLTSPRTKRSRARSAIAQKSIAISSPIQPRASTDDNLYNQFTQQMELFNPFHEDSNAPNKDSDFDPRGSSSPNLTSETLEDDSFNPRTSFDESVPKKTSFHRRTKSKSFNNFHNYNFDLESVTFDPFETEEAKKKRYRSKSATGANKVTAPNRSLAQSAELDFDLNEADPESWAQFAQSLPHTPEAVSRDVSPSRQEFDPFQQVEKVPTTPTDEFDPFGYHEVTTPAVQVQTPVFSSAQSHRSENLHFSTGAVPTTEFNPFGAPLSQSQPAEYNPFL